MNIKYSIVLAFLLISPSMSWAHNALSSRYQLEIGEKVSLLSINLSQDGINAALLKSHPREQLDTMSREEFEELIVSYIMDHFDLRINGKEIPLGKGGIKLGSHQTDLKFVMPPILGAIDNIQITIDAFKENDHHQTIFTYNSLQLSGKEILNEENGFTAIIDQQTELKSPSFFIVPFMAIVLFFIAFLILRFKKAKH